MSFVWKDKQRLKSPEQCARELLEVAKARGLDEFAAVLATMCVAQESDFWCPFNKADPSSQTYPHDSESDDGRSVGYFQQQNRVPGENPQGADNWWGPMGQRMDLKRSAAEFYNRLEDTYMDAVNNPALASNRYIQNVQRSGYPNAYAKHWDRAWQLIKGQPGDVVPDNRPDFNEYAMWSPNNSDRGGRKVDLFLLHTQEGDGNADSLARYLQGHEVSYHYTISEDYKDHGVTVVDVVDTDQASWSVLSANPRSINLCFAGSKASWTRQQWLQQSKAIDVAAYLAAQDCKKYDINPRVMAPPYNSNPPGISDHRYVTQWLKDGTHTDVGLNFPWDVFEAAVKKYTGPSPAPAPPVGFQYPPTDEMVKQIWEQLFGPQAKGWPQLGNKTLVDAVADLLKDKP